MREGAAPEQPSERSQHERRTFSLIVLVGVAALFFGALQILNTIRLPFSSAQPVNAGEGETSALIAQLTTRDTDGDGLSDFDELYVYNTSPYLADSDSDGTNDKQEIANNTDPNCPADQVCSALTLTTPTTNEAANGNASTNSTSQSALDAQALRVALQNAGAPAAALQQLDDADLLALYQELIGSSTTNSTTNTTTNRSLNTNTASGTNTNSTQVSLDLSQLGSLTPAQMREFLKLGGADDATLSQMDDDTLRLIFSEAISELNSTP